VWCALFGIRLPRELKATLERRRATLRESLKVCRNDIPLPDAKFFYALIYYVAAANTEHWY
jgi:hypothetical protein